MRFTRRDLLKGGAAAAAVGAVGGIGACASGSGNSGGTTPTPTGPKPVTTVQQTLLRGKPGKGGYVPLVPSPGEAYIVRTDLGIKAQAGRENRRTGTLAFAQITDVHVVDAQSPLRVEYTDRIGDPPSTNTTFNSAYRPQEMLTAQVADTMAATINAIGSGPVSGLKFGFTISTGDIADSCQQNELRWQIDILDGAHQVVADSGKKGTWEGVQGDDPEWYDVHYWHPDGTPAGKPEDLPKTTWGYPTVSGLMDAAMRPFTSTGIGMPWYVTFGNHDGEIQGNIPPDIPRLREIAVGDQKVWDPPPGMSAVAFLASFVATGKIPQGTRIRTVAADPARQVLTHREFIQDHFTTTGTPVGHGFTQANIDSDTGYYTFNPVPQIRAVSLDTVNPNGGADGSLDAAQFSWLKDQLNTARTDEKLVIVFSHHTITTMENGKLADPKTEKPRVTGDQVRELLLEYPNAIAWVNGHTHDNNIWARPKSGASAGFWEINTASHIDWPSQSRLIEVVDNQDGTLSIFSTIVDFAAPAPAYDKLDTPAAIASVAREFAANDWQDRTGYTATVDGRRGAPTDRNTELLVAKPQGF